MGSFYYQYKKGKLQVKAQKGGIQVCDETKTVQKGAIQVCDETQRAEKPARILLENVTPSEGKA